MPADRPGDSHGVGPVIDPTKNVLDLVTAAIQRQDDLRDAETRRVDQLAAQRVHYETIIENIRSTSLTTTSTLLATQLREVKNDLSDRTSKLEQFRWETGGRTGGRTDFWGYVVGVVGIAIAATTMVVLLMKG